MNKLYYKFIGPIKENEIEVFKYLENELVRFTQPSKLNDPFECRPVFPSGNKLVDIVDKCRKLAHWQRSADENIGIFSLCANIRSSAMWAHYAKNHTGMAIGFDASHSFFLDPSIGFSGPYAVQYRQDMCESDDGDVYWTKASEWSYEEEVRMVVEYKKCPPAQIQGDNIMLYRVPFEAVKRVVIGSVMEAPLVSRVVEWAKKHAVDVYQATLSDDRFRVEQRPYLGPIDILRWMP